MKFNEYFFYSLEKLLVMEYADCGSLQDYLKKTFNKLTWNNKCELAFQLACAVSFLHNKKIVHRELVIPFKMHF